MLYGDEKIREIARSVLPSTRRRAARGNAATLKRRNRRATRQTLHRWADEINPYDGEEFTYDYVYGWGPDQNIKMNVSDRRDGDKLGAIMRWAPKVTAHLDDPVDRYMFIKNVLPDSLIGRHALSHVAQIDGFEIGNPHLYGNYENAAARAAITRNRVVRESARVASAAGDVLRSGAHAELNRRIRRVHTIGHIRGVYNGLYAARTSERYNREGCDLRLLHGWHDVNDFGEHLVKFQHEHRADVDAVFEFWKTLRY